MSGRVMNFVGGRIGGEEFTIERIEIATPPDVVEYMAGDEFNTEGMEVIAHYSDGTSEVCRDYEVFPNILLPTTTEVSISVTWRGVTVTAVHPITVYAAPAIYGVEWDGTATTTLSRTDDAVGFTDPVPYVLDATEYSSSFDNIYPWNGMVRVTDPVVGELVAIPKFWYKWTQNGDALKLQISPSPVTGFYVSPAHMDRGDGYGERDVVYVGRYHCDSYYKSISGNAPVRNLSLSSARKGISALGAEYWQIDLAMLWTIRMLYLVEFANWDIQATIADECGSDSAPSNNGYTDSIPYHTGTTKGTKTNTGVSAHYRNIEGLWGNLRMFVDGCKLNSLYFGVALNPESWSDSTAYTSIAKVPSTSGTSTKMYIKTMVVPDVEGYSWCLYPGNAISLSEPEYIADHCWANTSHSGCIVGGFFNENSQIQGLFAFTGNTVGNSQGTVGCRLMKLPNPS